VGDSGRVSASEMAPEEWSVGGAGLLEEAKVRNSSSTSKNSDRKA
jgi:hypothetical protein